MIKKLVSIIIPFYNRIHLVEKALESAMNQTYLNKEIILIDDGSTESTENIHHIVKEYPNIFILKNRYNRGVSYSRNLGIAYSKGEYIAFLDSDDEWMDFKVQLQMDYIFKHDIDFIYTAYKRKNRNSSSFSTVSIPKEYKMPFMVFSCKIATPTVLYKKIISKGIHFNNNIRYGEDIIFWSKISKNAKLFGLNIPTTIVNVSNNSTSQSISNLKKAYKCMNEELFPQNSLISKIHYLYINLKLSIKSFFIFISKNF